MLQTYNSIKDRLVDKVYPLLETRLVTFYALITEIILSHQQSYFGYEEEEMEESIYPVCSSFAELLDSLYEFEDEDE